MGRLTLDRTEEASLRQSVNATGFGCLAQAIGGETLAWLLDEAEQRLAQATFAQESGALHYRARIVPLGPRARELLSGEETRALFADLLGEKVVLSETRSCVTVYGEGDHIGPHRDEPATECEFTLLAYLSASGAWQSPANTGLVLNIYAEKPVGGARPVLSIPTRSGSVVIGRGAEVWHERPPLLKGERVVALTACYARAPGTSPEA